MATVQGSWSLKTSTSAEYKIDGKVVATLTGLKSGVTSGNLIDGIEVTESGTIKLGNEVLGTSQVKLSVTKGYTYSLALKDDVTKSEISNRKSTISNGTLKITGDISEGYLLAADGNSISKITAKTGQELASVSGLKTTLTAEDIGSGQAIAINNSTGKITLTAEALAQKKVSLTLKNNAVYELATSGEISTIGRTGELDVTVSSGTMTIKSAMTEGYTLKDTKTIEYTAAKAATTAIAKVTNLNTAITKDNYTNYLTIDDNTITFDSTDAFKAVTSSTGDYTSALTLSNGGNFSLALNEKETDEWAPEDEANYWVTSNKGKTATYKFDTTAGWTLSGNSVVYKKAKTTTLATVTGLLEGTGDTETAAAKEADATNTTGKIYNGIAGITVTEPTDSAAGTITLDNRVLGASKVTVGAKENYKLAIDTDGTYPVDEQRVAAEPVWIVSGTTATLKNALPTYYSETADGKTINYTATDSKGTTLATVKGLAQNLVVGKGEDVNKLYTKDGTLVLEAIPSDDSATPGTIKIHNGAQATSNITIGATENYVFDVDRSDETGITAPSVDTTKEIKWTVKSGTTTMNGYVVAGFTESTNGKTLTYTKAKSLVSGTQNAKSPEDILSIKGLNLANTTANDNDNSGTGLLNYKGITVESQGDNGEWKVTLPQTVLGTSNVTVNNNAYKIAVDGLTDSNSIPKNEDYNETANYGDWMNGVNVWRINKSNVVYERVIPAYYTFSSTSNTVIYHAEAVTDVYATITGLDTTKLKYNENDSDKIDGISLNQKNQKKIVFDDVSLFKENTAVAFDTKNTKSGYVFSVADTADYDTPDVDDESIKWTTSKGTATLKGKTTAGWSVTDSKISYVKASTSDVTLATITGLSEDVKADNFESAVSDKEITLSENMLDKKNVEITGTAGYTLKVDSELEPEKGFGWSISGTTATLNEGTTAGYTANDSKTKLTYSDFKGETYKASIAGLKEGLTANKDGTVGTYGEDGQPVEWLKYNENETTVTLTEDVLGTSNITATNCKLALDSSIENYDDDGNIEQKTTQVWNHTIGSTVLLVDYTNKGYTVSTDEKTITYKRDKTGDTKATIEGLVDNVAVQDGKIGTVDKKGNFTEVSMTDSNGETVTASIGENGVVTLPDELLDKTKTVTIDGDGYSLALVELTGDDAKDKRSTDTGEWGTATKESGKSTYKATYKLTTTKGFRAIDADGEGAKSIVYYNGGTTDVTVSGLADDFTSNIEVDNDARTVTFDLLNESITKITLSSKADYKLVIGDSSATAPDLSEGWAYDSKNGKVTFTPGENYEGGWIVSSDGASIIHVKAEANATKPLITISGLVTGETLDDSNGTVPGVSLSEDKTEVIVSKSILGTKNVEVADNNNNKTTYKLTIADDVPEESEQKAVWRISGTTATYKLVNLGYYTYDEKNNKIVYHKESDVKGQTYVSISNLASGLKVNDDGTIDGISLDDNKITLSKSVLGTKDVTINNSGYELILGEDVPTATKNVSDWQNVTEWVTSGTTATRKTYDKTYYTLKSATSITANNPKGSGTTLATIKGIKKDADLNEVYNSSNMTVTLTKDQLSTTDVTITGGEYKLALANTVDNPKTSNLKLATDANATKVTLEGDITAGWTKTSDQKITYTKAQAYAYANNKVTSKAATLATISGLKLNKTEYGNKTGEDRLGITGITGIEIVTETNDDGEDEIVRDANGKGTIKISASALEGITGTGKVTLASSDNFKFEMDTDESTAVPVPTKDTTNDGYWEFLYNKTKPTGTAVYKYVTTAGFTLSADGKTLTHSDAKETIRATITGLNTALINDSDVDLETSSSKLDTYLKISDGGQKIILVTNDENDTESEADAITISKLNINSAGSVIGNGTITVNSKEVFDSKGKIAVGKNDTYTLAIDPSIAPQAFGDSPKWYATNTTTAELKSGMTSGYQVNTSDKSKSISFVKEAPGATVAKITGLKNVKVSTGTELLDGGETTVEAGKVGIVIKNGYFDSATGSKKDTFLPCLNTRSYGSSGIGISLSEDILGANDVKIESDGYFFIKEGDSFSEPKKGDLTWSASKGTATLKQTQTAGWTITDENKTLKYTKAGKDGGDVILTVSGLATTIPADFPANLTTTPIAVEDNVITVKKSALKEGNVTYKSTDKSAYTFKFANDVPTATNGDGEGDDTAEQWKGVTEWVTSGKTATYKTYDKGYYTYGEKTVNKEKVTDEGSIKYVKATSGTAYATIGGLQSGTTITSNDFDKATKTITLTTDMVASVNGSGDSIGATVTIKGDAYTLDISDDFKNELMSDIQGEEWSAATSSGVATKTGSLTGGYSLSEDAKTFTWTSKLTKKTLATVKGLKSGTTIGDTNGEITLSDTNLASKSVSLTGDGYYLNYTDDEASIGSAAWSSVKSGMATLMGTVTKAGYRLSPNKKTLIYTAASDKDTKNSTDEVTVYKEKGLATIKGAKDSSITSTISADDKTISITGGGSYDEKVSIIGGDFGVNFDGTFSSKSLTASANSDSLTIRGSNVSVSAGKGDDYIDLYIGNGGNVFVYGSDEGNDVIANFATSDKINITGSNITAENIKIGDGDGGNNDDAIISLAKGSITLKDYAKSNITIVDKSKKETTYVWDNGCYIADVQGASSSGYVLGDADFSLTPKPTLTNQSDAVAYSGDNKK